jgi:hypothetical protein
VPIDGIGWADFGRGDGDRTIGDERIAAQSRPALAGDSDARAPLHRGNGRAQAGEAAPYDQYIRLVTNDRQFQTVNLSNDQTRNFNS